jgi:hypothetical protein
VVTESLPRSGSVCHNSNGIQSNTEPKSLGNVGMKGTTKGYLPDVVEYLVLSLFTLHTGINLYFIKYTPYC